MLSEIHITIGAALLMGSILAQIWILRALDAQLPAVYKLRALQDKLVRMVIEGQIDRCEPHFEALYKNVEVFLRGCRAEWDATEVDGRRLTSNLSQPTAFSEVPGDALPEVLMPVVTELRIALDQLSRNHLGLWVSTKMCPRELSRRQRDQARQFRRMMSGTAVHA
jgi:hypothetical protein